MFYPTIFFSIFIMFLFLDASRFPNTPINYDLSDGRKTLSINCDYLRVDVRKNQSHKEGVRNRGPSIWLIFTYIIQFFTLILMVWFVFHKNDRMQDYGSFKFWQIRPREKIHNFLISEPNWMIIFYFVDLVEKNMVKIKRKFLEINFGGKNYLKLPYITVYKSNVS